MNFKEGVSFGEANHLLSDIVNGQVSAGLSIKGLWENPRPKGLKGKDALDGLKPGSTEPSSIAFHSE